MAVEVTPAMGGSNLEQIDADPGASSWSPPSSSQGAQPAAETDATFIRRSSVPGPSELRISMRSRPREKQISP